MPVTITPEHREALFVQALAGLSVCTDLESAIEEGDQEAAFRRGRRVSDSVRLIFDGGLGVVSSAKPTTLRLPDTELRAIVMRMRDEVAAAYESRRPDFEEFRRQEREVTSVRDACASVLDQT